MGLIGSVPIFGKKREVLRFVSRMMSLYYHMESKYGLERGVPSFSEARDNLSRIHSICMEHFLVEAYAKRLDGGLNYSFDPEIDGIVVNRKGTPLAVIEVKWTDPKKRDIDSFIERTEDLDCSKFILTKKAIHIEDEGIIVHGEKMIREFLKE